MRRSACGILAFGVSLCLCGATCAIHIDATFSSDYTPQQEACARVAIGQWERAITDNVTTTSVMMEIGSDVPGALAATAILYNPPGFALPPTPWNPDVEIRVQLQQTYVSEMFFDASSPVPDGRYDALTLFRHELGHAMGFADEYWDFLDRLTLGPGGSRTFNGDGFSVVLTPESQGTHMADPAYPGDLMVAAMGTGQSYRREISRIDLEVLADAYGYSIIPVPGDANGDGKINGGDLAIWQQNYDPLGLNENNTFAMGDWNGDGRIDGGDLALWQQNYDPIGTGSTGAFRPTADIPEPGTLLLMSLCSLGLLARSARRRRSPTP